MAVSRLHTVNLRVISDPPQQRAETLINLSEKWITTWKPHGLSQTYLYNVEQRFICNKKHQLCHSDHSTPDKEHEQPTFKGTTAETDDYVTPL